LFVSLVLAAVIHLAWIGLVGVQPLAALPLAGGLVVPNLWLATIISLLSAVVVFRTV
jgi:predicted small integral membrane protein